MTQPKDAPKPPDKPPEAPPEPDANAQLADAIEGGIQIEYSDQPGGGVTPTPSPDASAEKEPKPKEPPEAKKPPDKKGEPPPEKPKAKAPASKEKPPEGEPKPEVKPGEGDEDPWKGMKPKDILAKLLEHPEVGPVLQHWADTAGDAQSATAIEHERGVIANEAKNQAEDAHWDEHFKDMSEEDVAAELARDSKAAIAYSRYQQRQQEPDLDPARVTRASQVYGYAVQIETYNKILDESDLPDEAKAKLAGKNFTGQGPDGIIAWGVAIDEALVEQQAEVRANELMEERYETFQQEHMAETDGARPPMVRGRGAGGTMPDLIKTPTTDLFEDAFAQKKPPDKE
ncbi:hypothetical protein LCGC14_1209370 [marine sediment metagenome]|uniref:Uncharacterized protein n=1 Tax=marine sediment metagenome TaxID=412755 RepID=A0A0F9M1Y9_9ZZZZ